MNKVIGSISSRLGSRARLMVGAMGLAGMFAGSSASAQGTDIAYVPFLLNVDATVTATRDSRSPVSINVTANTETTLAVPLGGTNAVWYTGGARGRVNAPIITGARGNITLRLPAQSYKHAEIALHSVNGKLIMRGNADASEMTNAISTKFAAAGVYLLSVKGINGEAFTTRLTHNGGSVNINVAFGSGSVSPDRKLAKSAAEELWNIKVSADGYDDSTYTLNLVSGDNDVQVITLITANKNTFTDDRDGKVYKWTTIGSQTWMAENLNYDTTGSWEHSSCANLVNPLCDKMCRAYTWSTARRVCPAGWHTPSKNEWEKLVTTVGGKATAATKLKSTRGWRTNCGQGSNKDCNGTDEYGFSALPTFGEDFYDRWWSSGEEVVYGEVFGAGIEIDNEGHTNYWYQWDKGQRYNVRCVQD